jgi:hypothetical protein
VFIELLLKDAAADAEELDGAARALRFELLDFGVEQVEAPKAAPPVPGTKGEPVAIGALAVAVLPRLLPKLLEFMSHWLGRTPEKRGMRVRLRDGDRMVDIELDASQASLKSALALAKKTLNELSAASP